LVIWGLDLHEAFSVRIDLIKGVKVGAAEASHWRWQEGRSAVNAHRILGQTRRTAGDAVDVLQVLGGLFPSVEAANGTAHLSVD
jgi:hypothetical protein